jgi:hypothetical protein
MPNHVTNGLTIRHDDPKKIATLRKKVTREVDGSETFDFNAVIPMPKEMHITSGSSTDMGMACFDDDKFNSYSQYPWFADRYPNVKTKEDFRKELEKDEKNQEALKEGKQALENIEKYGFKDWYDWSVQNWGTKWNAYSFELVSEDSNTLNVQFDTAWSPPDPIFEKLQEMGYEVGAVSINEDSGVEPDYFGDECNFYVNRSLEFWG